MSRGDIIWECIPSGASTPRFVTLGVVYATLGWTGPVAAGLCRHGADSARPRQAVAGKAGHGERGGPGVHGRSGAGEAHADAGKHLPAAAGARGDVHRVCCRVRAGAVNHAAAAEGLTRGLAWSETLGQAGWSTGTVP